MPDFPNLAGEAAPPAEPEPPVELDANAPPEVNDFFKNFGGGGSSAAAPAPAAESKRSAAVDEDPEEAKRRERLEAALAKRQKT